MAQRANRSDTARRDLVNLRMSREDRNVIDRAARTAHKTRTEFMIDAARRAAQDALLDSTLVMVDGATFARFQKLLNASPRPNKRLKELVNQKAPWES